MKSLNILIVIFFFAASSISAQNASKKDKIKEAMSSAPASIAESATIMDFPAEEGGEMILLREGTNGYTCFPDMPTTSGYDPMCLDESWIKWVDAWMNQAEEVNIDKMGFGYMLQGGAEGSNVDPYATEPTDDNEWMSNPVPHLMIIFPNNDVLKGLPVTPDQGGPWVMFRNTPYVHVMAPMPKNNPSGTTTQAQENILPEYTMEQRWQSADFFKNSALFLVIRYGKLMGQDIEEVANATVEIFGPGWSNDLTPLQMVKNVHYFWMASQKAEFEVLEASEEIIRVRMNRPYLDFFGENGETGGISVNDYETLLGLYYERIAAERGMVYEQKVEGESMMMVVRKL